MPHKRKTTGRDGTARSKRTSPAKRSKSSAKGHREASQLLQAKPDFIRRDEPHGLVAATHLEEAGDAIFLLPMQASFGIAELMRRRARAYVEFPTTLVQCRSPVHAWSVQWRFLNDMFRDYQIVAQQLVSLQPHRT